MRRRTLLPLALTVALLALAGPALAAPPNPNHHVVQVLGRQLTLYSHFGDPNRGAVIASAQGELIDTNGNGLADSIRGRGALLEDHGVIRFRMYSISLQRNVDDTWRTVASDPDDVVSANNPAYLVNYTFRAGYCVGSRPIVEYRVVHHDAIRWDDETVGTRTTVSDTFTARLVKSDPDCPDLP
jgi:hypothetical protein